MKLMRFPAILAAALIAFALVPAASAPAVDEHAAEHARVVAFWTPARVAKAVPRDMVRSAGVLAPMRKPAGGDATTVLGKSWPGAVGVKTTTGKVLFAMESGYYVCSASVVADTKDDRALVLTAGHCVVDETNGQFATNWMFVPDYDSAPVGLTTDGSFCATTTYGCWVADVLVASDEFAGAGGFTDNATRHDYAFAVVSQGGLSDSAMLDETVGSQEVQFTSAASGGDTYLFGYPAAGKYRGTDLVYSRGPLGTDPLNDNQTYRVGSSMTGGSSGGPWFQGFDTATGTGTIMSVTSYGYSGIKALYGPMLNSETASMFHLAQRAGLGDGDQLG